MNSRKRKLSSLILLSLLSLSVSAQEINTAYKDTPIEKVFADLKKKTNHEFVYQKQILQGVKPVTCTVEGKGLGEVLSQVLQGTGLTYEIVDKTVIIRRRQDGGTPDEKGTERRNRRIHGMVTDENNEPMWYLERVNEYTYDSQNRVIDRTDTWYNEDGSLNSTNEQDYVYVNEGASDYEYYQRVIDASGQQTAYMGQKYELKVGNPTQYIYSEQATENGPWKVAQIINYYYPGPLTSNATISDNAEPTFKAYATDGSLVITTTGARAVQVYGIAGACHYNATVNGSATISNLPAGIYVIASEGETMKISVR